MVHPVDVLSEPGRCAHGMAGTGQGLGYRGWSPGWWRRSRSGKKTITEGCPVQWESVVIWADSIIFGLASQPSPSPLLSEPASWLTQ